MTTSKPVLYEDDDDDDDDDDVYILHISGGELIIFPVSHMCAQWFKKAKKIKQKEHYICRAAATTVSVFLSTLTKRSIKPVPC